MGIMELLAQLNSRGTTILVASHDLAVIEQMQRRIVRLEHGLVVEDIRPTLVPDQLIDELTPSLFEPSSAVVEAPDPEAVDA